MATDGELKAANDDASELRAKALEAIKEADKQLALYPPVAFTPEWHPYYWLGVKDAAKRIR